MTPNVYFLYGNEEYGIARRLKEFEGDFPDTSAADMNLAHLDAFSMTENDLNNAVLAMPFLAPKRLIILNNPSARYTKANERKKFKKFIENVPETARLVMHELIDPKDIKSHWLVKWAGKNSTKIKTQAFMLPRPWEMTGWIINETKKKEGSIEPSAAAKLAEMVGVNTRQAGQEIDKLLAYVNWKKQVEVQDVEAVSIVTAQESVFDFVDALANGDGKSAQYLLHRLLEDEDAFSLWGMVVRQFRLLLQAREVIDSHGDKDQVAKALHVHPYVAEKTTGQARRFTMISLEAIYHNLLAIDEGVKSSEFSLEFAMDTLVMELTS